MFSAVVFLDKASLKLKRVSQLHVSECVQSLSRLECVKAELIQAALTSGEPAPESRRISGFRFSPENQKTETTGNTCVPAGDRVVSQGIRNPEAGLDTNSGLLAIGL